MNLPGVARGVISEGMKMNVDFFTSRLREYARKYDAGELFRKIGRMAKKAGMEVVYVVLVLYYASFDKQIPVKDRLLIAAALGYFICPFDLLPDAIPGGFADDATALTFVARKIWSNLSPETMEKARRRLHTIFPDQTPPPLPADSDI